MLDTGYALYQSFLEGIKKEYSGTVIPEVFVRIWNEWAQPEWVSGNVSMEEGIELTQKQIDDLEPLRRLYVFDPALVNAFNKPDGLVVQDENGVIADRYLRQLSIMFRLDYSTSTDQECGLTGVSDWQEAKIMRSDRRTYFLKSPYRKPADSRLYYEVRNKVIYMVTDTTNGSNASKMRLEYLTFPNNINTDGIFPVTVNDVPSILWDYQRTEIVRICVDKYLERVTDPRWQAWFQTMSMASPTKM